MSASIFSFLWVLWPVVALAGGLAFAPLSGVAAMFAAPAFIKRFKPRIYMALLAAFFVYAAVSATWSPQPMAFAEIDFAKGDFNIRSEVARVGLLFLALGVLLSAATAMTEKARARVAIIAQGALIVQLLIVAVLTVFENQILEALRPIVPDTGEGVQNITRNCLIMAVMTPALVGLLAQRRTWANVAAPAAIILAVEVAILFSRDVQAGMLALAAASGCIAVVYVLPRHGFRILGVLVALAIMAAPLVFSHLSAGANAETATTSSGWRLAIWARACEEIAAHPVFGGGVGVLRTIKDVIPSGAFAGQMYMPNHPHNMLLQLWSETGAVGAFLISAAIVAAAWRLPSPRDMGRAAFQVAGLLGGAFVVATVSFDLWREWWWAAVGLLATLSAISMGAVGKKAEALAVGITFGAPTEVLEGAVSSAPTDSFAATRAATETPPAEKARTGPDHANNFNLLRLIFALMVAAYHVVKLSGAWPGALRPLEVAAEIGVQGFFIVSGYLVYASLERSSLGLYAEKRVRRLYPAYATVIIVTTLAGLALSPAAQASLGDVARYFFANIVFLNFLEPNLPGVFEANPMREINGALWTLKVEVMFYLVLPILAWMLRAAGPGRRWPLLIAIYVAAEIWRYAFVHGGLPIDPNVSATIGRQLPGQMSFFVAGMALYLIGDGINWRSLLLPAAIGLLAASMLSPAVEVFRAASLAVVIVWAATVGPRLPDAARFGDLSYGVYIIHFPIIQVAVAMGLFAVPLQGLGVVAAVSFVLALAMWWLVERPALRTDSAYRDTPRAPA